MCFTAAGKYFTPIKENHQIIIYVLIICINYLNNMEAGGTPDDITITARIYLLIILPNSHLTHKLVLLVQQPTALAAHTGGKNKKKKGSSKLMLRCHSFCSTYSVVCRTQKRRSCSSRGKQTGTTTTLFGEFLNDWYK